MKLVPRWSLIGGICLGVFGTWGVTTLANSLPGNSYSRVIFENDMVRVRQAVFMPGDANPGMHTHDLAHVGVPLDDGRLTFRYSDGKSETMDLKVGSVGFRDANVTHEAINQGSKPMRVIEVEIKR